MNSLTPPTVTTPPAPGNAGLPIAAVERETGLGKDTLNGGLDSDTYAFKKQYGQDLVIDEGGELCGDINALSAEKPGRLVCCRPCKVRKRAWLLQRWCFPGTG